MEVSSAAVEQALGALNPEQRRAATHGDSPLLIVAGAGTGKTTTLAHRVAYLIATGTPPGRVLLLTFTRRAAGELLRRTDGILRRAGLGASAADRVWGGTFHAIAARLLRRHAEALGLPNDFSIHDRADAEDLLDVVRRSLGLGEDGASRSGGRFPKKGTLMDVYSRSVNARMRIDALVEAHYPWCRPHLDALREVFSAYVDRKQAQGVLDYDDLLLFWRALLEDPLAGKDIAGRFDCVLVDEYQDTNALQAEILERLRPEGVGLTAVGDDAQSIYSFRAATVRNILDFPATFPGTRVLALEQSYRAGQAIVEATNRVIARARERHEKTLWSARGPGARPQVVTCADEDAQTDWVIARILERHDAGTALHAQAVLFRASHHSTALELELGRRGIPFHKYGGLKFVEAAHVKDLLAFLRLAENPKDVVAATRTLLLLPGVGGKRCRAALERLEAGGVGAWTPDLAMGERWRDFLALQGQLGRTSELGPQIHAVREFYAPICEDKHDDAAARLRDLETLEVLAARYPDRKTFLAEIALDPPSSTQDLAGPPRLDDDHLVLSTIHSAKGLEWDAVYVIHAADGNIPSDLATGRPEEIDEELRLFYVALTRARDHLAVTFPLRYYTRPPGARGFGGDAHGYAQRTRFLERDVLEAFEQVTPAGGEADDDSPARGTTSAAEIRDRLRELWR